MIPGEGQFDGSLSEGMADTLAVSITGDHGMGRGFFFNDSALRDVGASERRQECGPKDADGEPHDEGEIIGETLWDTRVALQNKLGTRRRLRAVPQGLLRGRAARRPTSRTRTPPRSSATTTTATSRTARRTMCAIQTAFAKHGLVDPAATLGLAPPTRDNYTVSMTITPPSAFAVPAAERHGRHADVGAASGGTGGQVALAQQRQRRGRPTSRRSPTARSSSTRVDLTLADGSTIHYPQNKADPSYQMYVGAVTPIWCADFESGIGDWTHGASTARTGAISGKPARRRASAATPRPRTAARTSSARTSAADDGLYADARDSCGDVAG